MSAWQTVVFCLVCGAMGTVAWACDPQIYVHHLDPTQDRIAVAVDGKRVDVLEFDETVSVRVKKGPHRVMATAEGERTCRWTQDGEPWEFWVDDDARLTLLRPQGAVESKKSGGE